MSKEDLTKEGFMPLIEWEEKYEDKLLISFPSKKYRKFDIIARPFDDGTCVFWKIDKVIYDFCTGIRVPCLIAYEYNNINKI